MYVAGADPLALWVQSSGALLFALVFVFLWRRSGVIYFALWAAAWTIHSMALTSGAAYLLGAAPMALSLYGILQLTFATLLLAAARAGFSGTIRGWRGPLNVLMAVPAYLIVLQLLNWHDNLETFDAVLSSILGAVFVYNSTSVRGPGLGGVLFRISLMAEAAVHFYRGGAYFAAFRPSFSIYFDSVLHAALAFSATAMWIENQQDRLREIGAELDRVRRENLTSMDLDYLTGLMNQSALSRRMDEQGAFEGVVAVCDMDNFKEINDRYGHLVGDEILRAVGHLLRTSVRPEDEAFRWGGDEFVVCFHNQDRSVAQRRMHEIAERLRGFRVRGHGILPISFSWGIADGSGRRLREVLDEADRSMYALKRSRR